MAGIGPELPIQAPPLTPPPNGLLKAAAVIPQTDDRWLNGVRFEPELGTDTTAFDPCLVTNPEIGSTFTDGVSTALSTTFTSATAAFENSDPGKTITSAATANFTATNGVSNTDNSFVSSTARFSSDDVGKGISSSTTANFTFTDGVINTDTSLVSATANFTSDDVGKTVSGTGIFGGSTIASVTNATTVILSNATTATATGVSVTITARKVVRTGTTIVSVTNATTAVLSLATAATTTSITFVIASRKVIVTGTTIASVTNATTVVLDTPAAATGTAETFTILSREIATNNAPVLTFLPFVLEAHATCSTFGYQRADYEGRARRALAARESGGVEAEFWLGTIQSGNRHLADSNTANTTVLNGGTAYSLLAGLSALVQAAADYNLGTAQIHARPSLVTAWSDMNVLYKAPDGKIYTVSGILIVPGEGYPGTGPAGQAVSGTSEWAYVTDPVQVWRQENVDVFVPENNYAQNVRRDINEITVRAQRAYVVIWNAIGCIAANINPTVIS